MKRSLKSRALQLLAQRDQSRVELRRKLLAHALAPGDAVPAGLSARESNVFGGAAPEEESVGPDSGVALDLGDVEAQVDAVLDWLEARRFLSAERFAESRINARATRFGNLRIRHELARHDVEISPEAEQALADSERARADSVRSRKFSAAPSTPAENARQARFLAARGFSSDVIRTVLREAARGADAGVQAEDSGT